MPDPGPPEPPETESTAENGDPPASTPTMEAAPAQSASQGFASGDNNDPQAPPVSPAPPPTQPEPTVVPDQPPLLFEVAWEVCWQLGGIYTVLRSKAGAMLERWGDRYCLIGPYNPQTAPLEFEEQPAYGSIKETITRLRDGGLPCYFGRWLIDGRPRVILLDYRALFGSLDHDKFLLWEHHGITTLTGDGEVNEVVAFGFAVTQFLRQLTDVVKDRPILAHFHEWMAGVAVPRIAHEKIPVATVFTTHATLLGRYLASENPYFYDHLPFLDPEAEARKYNILPRYQIEKAAAHAATVFSTVSEVTAGEAAKILGRGADVIMPNGLNIRRFAAPHEFQYLHQEYKERIHAFVMGHFFPSYSFDLDNTIYLFTSGRYEYRNKGMDLYIEALCELNRRLKQLSNPPTVVAFIITKAAVKNINVSVLQNQSMFDDLRHTCTGVTEQMGRRLFLSAATHKMPTFAELLPDDSLVRLKRGIHAWRTNRQPLIVTHDMQDDANDPILKHLRHRWLFNHASDPVKIVFHPDFITATSPVISLDYEQFVRGCHMGIFPSYYEPWGYTPMECVALGLPAVTSDLSGFGAYVGRHLENHNERGILVLDRRYRSFGDAVWNLTEHLLRFLQLSRRQRIELRNNVEKLGELFDWSVLVRHYDEAHNLALERVGARRGGKVELRMV
jgi:glycogen(starch) synthase